MKKETVKPGGILDNMPDCAYIVNKDYTIEYVNSSMRREFGEPEGKKCYEYLRGNHKKCPSCSMEKVLSGKTKRWEWKDQRTNKVYDIIESPVQQDDGELVKLKVLRDITERKRLERRIEYLARFPGEDPNPVMRVQDDGIVRYANNASLPVLEEWGIQVEEAVPVVWKKRIKQALAKNEPLTVESCIGEDVYSLRIAPVGEKNYANIYGTEITELKKSHEREKEAVKAATVSQTAVDTIEAMEEGVALIDMNGTVQKVNPALINLTGRQREQLENKNIIEIIRELLKPEDIPNALKAIESAKKGTAPKRTGTNMVFKKENTPIIPRIVFIRNESDEPEMMVLTVQDISDVEKANKALREQAERLAEAQRIAHLGHWEWNICTNELHWSDEIYRIFGIDKNDFGATYDAFLSFVHTDDREGVQGAVDTALQEGVPYSIDHRVVRPDDTEVIVHEQGRVFRDEEGNAIRMVGTVQDITERKHLQKALSTQEKLASLGRVAAGIAHEIRNPLSGMQIFLDTIRDRAREKEELNPEWIVDILKKIAAASHRIESVIKRVMDFAKPASPKFIPIDINQAVKEAADLSKVSLRKSGVDFTLELEESLPECKADSHMLSQVILNLVSNSAEAMKTNQGDRKLRVRTKYDQEHIQVIIDDNGPGIEKDVRGKIFDPFFTTKQEGTGIGLSLCHRIISDHGGGISAGESEWGGAEFTLTLPAEHAEQYMKKE